MSFFYADPASTRQHKNPEGLVARQPRLARGEPDLPLRLRAGTVIVLYGLMLRLHPLAAAGGRLGSFLVFVMSFVTLSFLVTTPETWVPALGDPGHGFPYLTGAGRLVIKDAIMIGAALVTMANSARAYLRARRCWWRSPGLARRGGSGVRAV